MSSDALAAVEAARGGAGVDPVAFAVIEALARRAASQQGEARAVMLRRVEQLLAAQRSAPARSKVVAPRDSALAGLSELIDRLGRSPGPNRAAPEPLKAMTAFKGTWSRLKAEQRLRQALAQVPAQAGPLNSSHVVHHALKTIHALSPAYLDALMSHIDTLLWLDQASGGDLGPRAGNRVKKCGPDSLTPRAHRAAR